MGALGGATGEELLLLEQEIARSHDRLAGMTLTAQYEGTKKFDCGNEALAESTSFVVVYGSTDGTGCGVYNENHFKRFSLSVTK